MLQVDFQDQIFNADGFVAKKFSQFEGIDSNKRLSLCCTNGIN
jgi:hypothetical protein